MAVPAMIISFLFSLVWYWNETGLAAIYFGNSLTTLPLELQRFSIVYEQMYGGEGSLILLMKAFKWRGHLLPFCRCSLFILLHSDGLLKV